MKLDKFDDFITESKLQILLEELKLTMSDDISTILVSMNNPIAAFIMSDKNDDNDKLRITDFEMHPTKNDQILFDGGKQSVYVGRLATAYLKSVGINPKTHYFIKEPSVEDFVNKYKAAWDSLHSKFDVEVLSGDKIKWGFNENNYLSKKNGTLANSCMRYHHCHNYFDIYTDNSACKMLVQIENDPYDPRVKGRAMLWEAEIVQDSLENTKKILFMDRIYTNNDSDVILFIKWARDNGYHYKMDQESSEDTYIMFNGDVAYEDYNMIVNLDKNFASTKWPYLDTLKYYYQYKNDQPIISNVENFSLLGSMEFEMEEMDGSNSNSCSACDGTQLVPCDWCDGNGQIFCDECGGSGSVTDYDGDKEDCPECNGNGKTECYHCEDGEVPCPECKR